MSKFKQRLRHPAVFLTVLAVAALAFVAGTDSLTPQGASASHTVPVTVTITRLTNLGDEGIEDNLRGEADLYACVFIFADGLSSEKCTFDTHKDGDDDVEPFVDNPAGAVLTTNVPGELGSVAIVMEVWDHDGCPFARCFFDPDPFGESDDLGDADPGAGGNVDLFLDLSTGVWSGDTTGTCLEEDPNDTDSAVRICWDISTQSASGDADGDGLLDGWETRGYDADGNGTIDVDLPAFGADPNHKDLFLELDTVAGQSPTRDDIQGMIAAFAAAPIDAGSAAASQIAPNGGAGLSAPNNPDGQRGINLHVDTGARVDPNGVEGAVPNCRDGIDNGGDGTADVNDADCQNQSGNRNYLDVSIEDAPATNCGDSVDNDSDGQTDATDTDCLIGDNLGGGNTVPRVGCLDSAFYTAKGANFNANRRLIFRYAISGNPADNNPCRGGQGEIGGNDFVEFNHDGGTVMHELGHTLNLHHGGNDDNNCKPNYVSGMDYNEQFGIFRSGGSGGILDYSPPRVALDGSTRGQAPLATLVENNLTEPTTLDTTDTANQFVFTNGNGTRVFSNLNQPANWNGDATDPPFEAGPLTVNIDNATGSPARPSACVNGASNSTLTGFHDWNAISMTFRQFGDAANGAVNFDPEVVPTLEDFQQFLQELNTTDLAITKSDSPDPVIAGEQLYYDITVTNNGPNPANNVKVTDVLPTGLVYVTSTVPCTEAPTGTLTCNLGTIGAGDSRSFTIKAEVPSNYIVGTGPVGITNTAAVENVGGVDTDATNNSASASTIVEDSADLRVTKICKPDGPLRAGDTGTCTIFVDNLGPSDARNVVLTDAILSDGAFAITGASFSPGGLCGVAGGDVSCGLGTEPAGGRTIITVTVTANEAVDINDVATVASGTPDPDSTNNRATESISVTAVADLSITKSGAPEPVTENGTLTYTIGVRNDGPSTAVNVVVSDVLPAELVIVSVSATSPSACNLGTPGVPSDPTRCTFSSLPKAVAAGPQRTMTIVTKVKPNVVTDQVTDQLIIHNDARVSSDTFDANNSNDLATWATTVQAQADLVLEKSAYGTPIAGTDILYEYLISNNGPSVSRDVTFRDNLPTGTSFVDAFVDVEGGTGGVPLPCTISQPINQVLCPLGDIALTDGAPVIIRVTVHIAASVPNGTLLTNNADVLLTDTPDPDAPNSQDDVTVVVQAIADIMVTKTSDADVYKSSGSVVYSLAVHNNGPSDAQGVVLTDNLPVIKQDRVIWVTMLPATCAKVAGGVLNLSCNLGTIASGATKTVKVIVIFKGSRGFVTNKADVTTTTTDLNLDNNTSTKVVLVGSLPKP